MKRLKHGWIPALPDARHYAFVPKAAVALPASVDLRSQLPDVWDQQAIGSCVAHGVSICHVAAQRKHGGPQIMPSRLALYFQARAVQGWQAQDSGCQITDAMKVTAKLGVADEKLYPYQTSKYKLKPPASVYANGLLHQSLEYRKIDNSKPENIMSALAEGLPVVFGSTLYSNYDKLDTNNVMPDPDLNGSIIGGHCMALVGYDTAKKQFLVRNSWSKAWGDKGHHWMSFDYICNLSLTDDVWVLRKVE
jgi:C1A family cysteine protease